MKWYLSAIFCGVTPLISGCTIFLYWLITRDDWLKLAGYYCLLIGLLCFAFGILSLAVFAYRSKKQQNKWIVKWIIALLVLLINFPIAAAIIESVSYIESAYKILINNRSTSPIHTFEIDAKNEIYKLGNIAPMSQCEKTFHFSHEGSVHYSFEHNNQINIGILIGYVSGLGGTTTMTIDKDGTVNIKEI